MFYMDESGPSFHELQDRGRRVGTLVVMPTRALAEDLTTSNQFSAQVYEYTIMAYLRLNGGTCTMWDLYNESDGGLGLENDIALYLAVHSLLNKGCIKAADPYRNGPLFMDEHTIKFRCELKYARTCPRRIMSRWEHLTQYAVKTQLTQFRKELFGG